MDRIMALILAHQSPEGPFQVITNIPTHFGGSGKDDWSWQLCDAPLLIYCLIKFWLKENERVQKGISYLISRGREMAGPMLLQKIWAGSTAPAVGMIHALTPIC